MIDLLKEDMRLWQRIQNGTKEIDAMLAIDVFRINFDNSEKALHYQSQGNWNDALYYYELCLQIDPNNIEYQKGYMLSLLNLGQFHAIANYTNGNKNNLIKKSLSNINKSSLSKYSMANDWSNINLDNYLEKRYDLISYQIQSLWRLQRWDIMDEILENIPKHYIDNDFDCQL
ncbi:hypothetical protein RFI_37757, partial [Reticulomyxa filosa]